MDHAEGVHDALKAVEVAPEAPEVIRITHRRAKRPASRLPSDPSIITPPPPKRAGSKSKSVKTSSNGKTNSEKSHSALIFGVLALVVVVTLGLKYFEEGYDYDYEVFTQHYEVLGLPASPQTTLDEIRKAHHKLAIKYHPDKCAGREKCEENYVKILTAYEALRDNHVAFWEYVAREAQRRPHEPKQKPRREAFKHRY